jgi:hypothetical protein
MEAFFVSFGSAATYDGGEAQESVFEGDVFKQYIIKLSIALTLHFMV